MAVDRTVEDCQSALHPLRFVRVNTILKMQCRERDTAIGGIDVRSVTRQFERTMKEAFNYRRRVGDDESPSLESEERFD